METSTSKAADKTKKKKNIRQQLNTSQKVDIKQAFDYFDQGGSGKIKRKELKVIMRALGMDPSNDDLDQLMGISNFKDPRGGEIDFQEFMNIMMDIIVLF
jgi:Ca2+-binding EF-hand superfamily protein